jgi:hypothetical protein
MMDRRRSSCDRRRDERVSLVTAVKQRIGGEVQLALAQDVGTRGIALRRVGGGALPPRTPVAMTFELPDGGAPVRVRGAVVSERADGTWQRTGVRFDDLSPLDLARIVRLIHRSRG